MKLIILEGARGTGKSTLAFKLRQRLKDTTLVNFTGFSLDNEEGLKKVTDYYSSWLAFLYTMKNHDSLFISDRNFFSEAVFSELYKDYDFTDNYNKFIEFLPLTSNEIHIFNLTISDKEELKSRLIRDKVPFGKAEESVEQTLLQQEKYLELFANLEERYSNLDNVKIHNIATDGKTNDEIYDEITIKLEKGK